MGIGHWLYRSYVEAALSVPGVIAVHQLQVTWTVSSAERRLGNVADPGEGAYFALLPDDFNINGGYSND
jgi:hypothetical protein